MKVIKLKVHTIIFTHKHGEDVYLTKDKPNESQLKAMKKLYAKAYGVDQVDVEYYREENLTDLLSSNETIRMFKNMC